MLSTCLVCAASSLPLLFIEVRSETNPLACCSSESLESEPVLGTCGTWTPPGIWACAASGEARNAETMERAIRIRWVIAGLRGGGLDAAIRPRGLAARNVGKNRLGRGLQELETIAEGIVHVHAEIAGEGLVVRHHVARRAQSAHELA